MSAVPPRWSKPKQSSNIRGAVFVCRSFVGRSNSHHPIGKHVILQGVFGRRFGRVQEFKSGRTTIERAFILVPAARCAAGVAALGLRVEATELISSKIETMLRPLPGSAKMFF